MSATKGLSEEKLARIFTGRANEMQLISNGLYGRTSDRNVRAAIKKAMLNRPIRDLDQVIDDVLGPIATKEEP